MSASVNVNGNWYWQYPVARRVTRGLGNSMSLPNDTRKSVAMSPDHGARQEAEGADQREPSIVKTATEARQGVTLGVLRWVLAISMVLAVCAMVIIFEFT
jgi:hypothetical protein